jgi:S1-C subfamily serine protease
MGRALEAHANPPPPRPRAGLPDHVEDYPAAARFKQGCIHCHNVNEFRRADAQARGRWDRDALWVYPLPENVGLTLDVDAGDRVKAVRPGSAADRAGLKPGDTITALAGHPVASFADASYALHKAPARGPIPVTWVRDGRERSADLAVADGWRKTNVTWRPSMLDILPSVPFSGEDLAADEKARLGLAAGRAAFRQDGPVHSSLREAGIRVGDVVIGVDGAAVDGAMDDLLGHVRRNYLVGETVTFNVLRGGQRADVPVVLK